MKIASIISFPTRTQRLQRLPGREKQRIWLFVAGLLLQDLAKDLVRVFQRLG